MANQDLEWRESLQELIAPASASVKAMWEAKHKTSDTTDTDTVPWLSQPIHF